MVKTTTGDVKSLDIPAAMQGKSGIVSVTTRIGFFLWWPGSNSVVSDPAFASLVFSFYASSLAVDEMNYGDQMVSQWFRGVPAGGVPKMGILTTTNQYHSKAWPAKLDLTLNQLMLDSAKTGITSGMSETLFLTSNSQTKDDCLMMSVSATGVYW